MKSGLSSLTTLRPSLAARRQGPAGRRDGGRPRHPALWGLSGLFAGWLVALAVFAPARWLGAWLAEDSEGHFIVEDARGTVWTGSARIVLQAGSGGADRTELPGRVHWRLRPGLGKLVVEITADCCAARPVTARVVPQWGGAHLFLDECASAWPAQVLAGLGTPWNTLAFDGRMALSCQDFSVSWNAGRMSMAGTARLELTDLQSRLSTLRPLGSYDVQIVGGATPQLQVSTRKGSLLIDGQGLWIDGKLHFEGQARAGPGAEEALSNLLNILGRRQGAASLIHLG